jgi:hypothetical protein
MREGFGTNFIIGVGRVLSHIEKRIVLLFENISSKIIHQDRIIQTIDILSKKSFSTNPKRDKNKKSPFFEEISKEIDEINKSIEYLNDTLLIPMNFGKIESLNKSQIIQILNKRIDKILNDFDALDLADENSRLLLSGEIKKPLTSIEEFFKQFEDYENFSGLKELERPYKKGILEGIHISSIRYGKTGVLCVGRTIEEIINEYFNQLLDKNKISKSDYDRKINEDYFIKICFLKGSFLTEEEFTDLQSFSFKRNKGGHPNLGEISNERAKTLIQQGIWIIIDLQKKIKKLGEKNDK